MVIDSDDNKVMLAGFIIALVVGLNVMLFFGNLINFSGNTITGAAAFSCADVSDGIECGTRIFAAAENGCASGTVKVCTTACDLANVYTNANNNCPSACHNVCVPLEIAQKL